MTYYWQRTFDTRERRIAAETDSRRTRKSQLDRVRTRLNAINTHIDSVHDLKNVIKAILDIMSDDGRDDE